MSAGTWFTTASGDERGSHGSVRRKAFLLASCWCAFLLLSVPSERYQILEMDAKAADSAQYHFIALNLLQGKGYRSRPVGSIEEYGESAKKLVERPVQTPLEDQYIVAAHRGPGYPLFLAAVYSIHGPRPDVVVRYQAVMAGLTGVLLVLIANKLWGGWAAGSGVIAAALLRRNSEMLYATSTLLSECLASFLLTLALLCGIWAKKGGWQREAAMGFVMSAAVLTRQALLPTALLYGLFLLVPFLPNWKRAVAYGLPCAIMFSGWTLFLSRQSGGTVVMASTGFSSVINGLDPVASAKANGLPAPNLDGESLAAYWGGVPIALTPGLAREVLLKLPNRLPEVVHLMREKLSIGLFWLPRTLIWCVLLGTALASVLALECQVGASKGDVTSVCVMTPEGAVRSREAVLLYCATAGVLFWLVCLGYSHPGLQLACIALVPAAFLIRAKVECKSVAGSRTPASLLWMSSWLGGYLAMTIMTIGVRRYVRPYLPVLILFAVAAVPLFVVLVGAALDTRCTTRRRVLRFRWNGPASPR